MTDNFISRILCSRFYGHFFKTGLLDGQMKIYYDRFFVYGYRFFLSGISDILTNDRITTRRQIEEIPPAVIAGCSLRATLYKNRSIWKYISFIICDRTAYPDSFRELKQEEKIY